MRTVLYARCASSKQNERPTEKQMGELRNRCDHEGWRIVDEFIDEGKSGSAGADQDARPGLWGMLNRIEAGDIDQVLVEDIDRISRHVVDITAIIEQLRFNGVRICTLSGGYFSGPIRVFIRINILDIRERIRKN